MMLKADQSYEIKQICRLYSIKTKINRKIKKLAIVDNNK